MPLIWIIEKGIISEGATEIFLFINEKNARNKYNKIKKETDFDCFYLTLYSKRTED